MIALLPSLLTLLISPFR